jgi:hypothetical protein
VLPAIIYISIQHLLVIMYIYMIRRGRDRMVVGFTTKTHRFKFNATFNSISVISWQSVLLVEETGIPRETTDPP